MRERERERERERDELFMVKYIVVFASMVLGKGGRIWGQGECWRNSGGGWRE